MAFASVPSDQVYELLEEHKLGPKIADLRFESAGRCSTRGRKQVGTELNMFRVLAACPNIGTLHFGGHFYDLLNENDFGLNPDSFQNYHW
jgi:hypothetical protein